jgi:uncharacterized RDD family membrane protein YckC
LAHISIETSQNVSMDLSVANTGERILAYLIDALILFIYYLLAANFFDFSSALDEMKEENAEAIHALANLLVFTAPIYFYDLIFEVFNKGKSPGKMLMRIQVIKLNGEPAGMTEYWLRWLMRPIDFYGQFILMFILGSLFSENVAQIILGSSFMFIGLFALISISKSRTGQRIGDLLAGTTVTKKRTDIKLSDTILLKTKSNYKPVYNNVLKLSDKDVRLIKETLVYYGKTNDSKYIKKLAKKAQEFLDVKATKNPVKFLRTLMKDYNHLAVEEDGRS